MNTGVKLWYTVCLLWVQASKCNTASLFLIYFFFKCIPGVKYKHLCVYLLHLFLLNLAVKPSSRALSYLLFLPYKLSLFWFLFIYMTRFIKRTVSAEAKVNCSFAAHYNSKQTPLKLISLGTWGSSRHCKKSNSLRYFKSKRIQFTVANVGNSYP